MGISKNPMNHDSGFAGSCAQAMRAPGEPRPVAGHRVGVWIRGHRMPGDVYFALRGPNHDGHDFVAAASAKGAAAVVVERAAGVAGRVGGERHAAGFAGAGQRGRASSGAGRVVGVTGSAGKTTTKDAIAHLLAAELPVGKTVGNFNNHVGVPLSILRLPDGCRVAVLEMGMNHAGEIRELAAIARPRLGVVTNVGYAHVEFFDSIEGVAAAKRELIEGLPRGRRGRAECRRSARAALSRRASGPVGHVRILGRRRCARRGA